MEVPHWSTIRNVVFLYDLSITFENLPFPARVDSEANDNTLVRYLSLCTIRLLKQLVSSASTTSSDEEIHWGFKFFDSGQDTFGVQCQNFRPLNSSTFEEFEEALSVKYRNSAPSGRRRRLSEASRVDLTPPKSTAPAVRLQKALHEILADFSWEIRSPSVKSSSNAVFLLTAVPTDGMLSEYCKMPANKDGFITPNAFKHCILPLKLFKSFVQEHGIHLHMIDTESKSGESQQIVGNCLKKMQSVIMPLTALVPELTRLPFALPIGNSAESCEACAEHDFPARLKLGAQEMVFSCVCTHCGHSSETEKNAKEEEVTVLGRTTTYLVPHLSQSEALLWLKPVSSLSLHWQKVLERLYHQFSALVVKWRDKDFFLLPVQGAKQMSAMLRRCVPVHNFTPVPRIPRNSPQNSDVPLVSYAPGILKPSKMRYINKPETQEKAKEMLTALKQRYASALSRQKTSISLPPPRAVLRRRRSNESLMSSISKVPSETESGCSKASKSTVNTLRSRGSAMLQKSIEARHKGHQETKEKAKKEQELAEQKENSKLQLKKQWTETIQLRIAEYEQTAVSADLEQFAEGLLQIKEAFVEKDEVEMQSWDMASLAQGLVGCVLRRTKRNDRDLELLLEKLTLPPSVIKQRDWQPNFKLREYQFQVLFTLDLLWTFPSKDNADAVDNVSTCLRFLSLQASAQLMKGFLEQTVVEFYGENLSSVIKAICEELNVPVPAPLLEPSEQPSEEFTKIEEPKTAPSQEIRPPEPKATQKLGRHNSLNLAKQKLVPLVTKRLSVETTPKEPEKPPPRNVKRNLFEPASTVPGTPGKKGIMKTPRKRAPLTKTPQKSSFPSPSPCKTPQRHQNNNNLLTPRKSPRLLNKLLTPCRTGVVLVPETPESKAQPQAEGVTFIAESPDVKIAGSRTPRGGRKMVRHGTSSFYMQATASQSLPRSASQLSPDKPAKASVADRQMAAFTVPESSPDRVEIQKKNPQDKESPPEVSVQPAPRRLSFSSPRRAMFELGTPSKDLTLTTLSATPTKTPRRKVRRALLDFDEPKPSLSASALTSPNSSVWNERHLSASSALTEENASFSRTESEATGKKRKWEELDESASQDDSAVAFKATPIRELRASAGGNTPLSGSMATEGRNVRTKYAFTPPSSASLLKLQFAALAEEKE